jgi:hypothetical protein
VALQARQELLVAGICRNGPSRSAIFSITRRDFSSVICSACVRASSARSCQYAGSSMLNLEMTSFRCYRRSAVAVSPIVMNALASAFWEFEGEFSFLARLYADGFRMQERGSRISVGSARWPRPDRRFPMSSGSSAPGPPDGPGAICSWPTPNRRTGWPPRSRFLL